jgi:hypothetical protein
MDEHWHLVLESTGMILAGATGWMANHLFLKGSAARRRKVAPISLPMGFPMSQTTPVPPPRLECQHKPADCLREVERRAGVNEGNIAKLTASVSSLEAEMDSVREEQKQIATRYDRIEELFMQMHATFSDLKASVSRLEGYFDAMADKLRTAGEGRH